MHGASNHRSTASAAAALLYSVEPTLPGPQHGERGASLVDPRTLDPAARERLTLELFATAGQGRDAATLRRFAAELMPQDAARTVISVYRDDVGLAVGYLAFHEQEVDIDARRGVALRGAVQLPEHLRSPEVGAFFLGQAAQALLRARGRPVVIIQALSDPAAYAWLYRVADRVWPSPARQTPPMILSLRAQLIPQLGLGEAVGSPELREVGTALSPADARRWRRHPRPEVHYFVGRNPGFDRGHGLVTVIPLSAGGLLRACLRSRFQSLFGGLLRRLRSRRRRPSLPSADRRRPIDRGR